ncbi:Protein OS-9 [Yamadazyma tenuis]|nr:Protein OS-9 [Yamadazyma tenuis]
MVNINNQDSNVVCFLPNLTDDSVIKQLSEDESKEIRPQRSDKELLRAVMSNFTSYLDTKRCTFTTGLNDGYWTYAYCFGDKVIQFHEDLTAFRESGQHKPENPDFVFVLGRFNGSQSHVPEVVNQGTPDSRVINIEDYEIINDPVVTAGYRSRSPKALRHVLRNGEICDLTQEPRTIEVIYRCAQSSDFKTSVFYVKEQRTCEYTMIVNVRGLCEVEEFAPFADEKVVDIICDVKNTSRGFGLAELAGNELVFPRPNSTQVDIQDFNLIPGGKGFFWGKPKHHGRSESLYDKRFVVFCDKDMRSFIETFPRVFSDSMEFKQESPFPSEDKDRVTWDDTFVAWYEVYNYSGEFLFVVKVARKNNLHTKEITIQLVDPFTMMDQDGDPVEVSIPVESRGLYHFEKFSKEIEQTKTLIVTMTVPGQFAAVTNVAQLNVL